MTSDFQSVNKSRSERGKSCPAIPMDPVGILRLIDEGSIPSSEQLEEIKQKARDLENTEEALIKVSATEYKRGLTDAAISTLQQLININKDSALAHANIGALLISKGLFDKASAHLDKALSIDPDLESAIQSKATLLFQANDIDGAELYLRDLLRKRPENYAAIRDLAICLTRKGQADKARMLYESRLEASPNNERLILDISLLLIESGAPLEAIEYLFYLSTISPGNVECCLLSGYAHDRLGDVDSAIWHYRSALEADSSNPRAMIELGNCLYDKGLTREALTYYGNVIKLKGQDPALLCNIAICLRHLGYYRAALKVERKVIEKYEDFLPAYREHMFSLSIGDGYFSKELLATGRKYWQIASSQNKRGGIAYREPPSAKYHMPRQPNRLRIGILSAEFRMHAVGNFLPSLLKLKNSESFEVTAIVSRRHHDNRAKALLGEAGKSIYIDTLSQSEASNAIKRLELDIIIETSGFTRGSAIHLLANRCAPIQCHYIGFHASTCMPEMDYFIADNELCDSSMDDQFTEKVWRLSRTWLTYTPFHDFPAAERVKNSPYIILGCFNQLTKVRSETLSYWAEVMIRIPQSRLIIKDRLIENKEVKRRIVQHLSKRGVSGDRLTFLPMTKGWDTHMRYYNMIDIALDTTPWSSATTGFEAIAMGVPILPIKGNSTSARMSSSIAKGLGHPEWIADNPETYADNAERLCTSIDNLRSKKRERQLLALESSLFQSDSMSKALAKAFIDMKKGIR